MKALVIPDIHLKPWLLTDAELLMDHGAADIIVCLMDIADDWNQEFNLQLYELTYDAAIHLAGRYPNTRFCYGNHDLSYMWKEPETGYSSFASNTVQRKILQLQEALPEDNPICYVQRIDKVLFSHAGLLDYFVDIQDPATFTYRDVDSVLNRINSLDHHDMWNDASPIWVRPQRSNIRMYRPDDFLQVVGHTPQSNISYKRTNNQNLLSCDVFSTYRDGSKIGTCEYVIVDTETWEYSGIKCPITMKKTICGNRHYHSKNSEETYHGTDL